MRRTRLVTLVGSVALHVGAVAALMLLVATAREPEPLFVDLTNAAPAGDERPVASGPVARAAAGRAGPARATAPPAPASPPSRAVEVSPAPAAQPSRETPAPRETPPPREPTSPREPAAIEPTRPPAAEPAAESNRLVSGAASTSAGTTGSVVSDAPAAAGSGTAGGGSGGSRVALATPGTGRGEVPAEYGPYLARFRQRIQEQVVYPLAARRRGLTGRVEVDVLLEPTGRVRDVTIAASSSHAMLDEAAIDAVKSLTPMPLPDSLPRRPLRVRLPIVFDLQ